MKRSADPRSQIVPFPDSNGAPRYLDSNASHARLYSEWRHLEAFKTLTPLQRTILQDILMDFTKAVGNEVRLTGHGVSEKYRVGHKKARAAIAGLEERGWILRVRLSPGPTGQAGGVYQILCMGPTGNRMAGPYQTVASPGLV
jgi:hypothetical protein